MRTLEQALGALATQTGHGLGVSPATARELATVLQVLKDAQARLQREVTLSREALSQLGPVEDRSMTVSAGAGVRLSALEAALQAKGLSLGPLPPGAWPLELGAFLEGPYAGLRAIHGGRLEPLCVQLEGVLADGRVVRTLPGPHNATGPDLAALFLGGGGRLALVTGAVLRACPAAPVEERVAYAFATAAHAVDFVRQVIADGVLLAAVRLQRDGARFLAELAVAGTRSQVERDRGTAHRALHGNAGIPHLSASPRKREEGGEGADRPEVGGRGPHEHVDDHVHVHDHVHVQDEDLRPIERECAWPNVELALAAGQPLELFRLSLTTAVALGEVEGLRLDQEAPWGAASALAPSLDPHRVLGGAP